MFSFTYASCRPHAFYSLGATHARTHPANPAWKSPQLLTVSPGVRGAPLERHGGLGHKETQMLTLCCKCLNDVQCYGFRFLMQLWYRVPQRDLNWTQLDIGNYLGRLREIESSEVAHL